MDQPSTAAQFIPVCLEKGSIVRESLMSETMLWDISIQHTAYTAHTTYTPVEYQYLKIYGIYIYVYPYK